MPKWMEKEPRQEFVEVDGQGLPIRVVLAHSNTKLPNNVVQKPPKGMKKPKWNKTKWEESTNASEN